MASTELTIVLPLKGRDDFSIRWFSYAASHALPYKVLVADGGHDEGFENRLRRAGIFDKIDCDYVRYPFDSSLEMFFRKMADALRRVETPYAVIANNDDFIFFDALETSITFLNGNPDFACSRGEIWDFAVASEGTPSPIYGRMTGVCKLYFHPTVVGENALERIADLAIKFNGATHDIVRTPVLADTFAKIVDAGLYDMRFAERLSTFLVAAAGKMHRDDHLHMLHQSHPDMSAVTHFQRPSKWVTDPDWDRNFNIFAGSLASAIAETDGMEFHQAKNEVFRIATRYFLDWIANDVMSGDPEPRPPVREAFLESAKWLVRRAGLEKLARGIHSGVKGRADAKPLPPSHARKFAEIKQFLKTPPCGYRESLRHGKSSHRDL